MCCTCLRVACDWKADIFLSVFSTNYFVSLALELHKFTLHSLLYLFHLKYMGSLEQKVRHSGFLALIPPDKKKNIKYMMEHLGELLRGHRSEDTSD